MFRYLKQKAEEGYWFVVQQENLLDRESDIVYEKCLDYYIARKTLDDSEKIEKFDAAWHKARDKKLTNDVPINK